MKTFFNYLLSLPFMGFLVLFMAASAGIATFIENDFGAVAARAKVYDTWWFELVLVLLLINIIGNSFRKKLFQKKKWTIFLFHFAFLFMFIGAAITRYISYEGSMHIREGASSDYIVTSESYIYGTVSSGNQESVFDKQVLLNPVKRHKFSKSVSLNGTKTHIKLAQYIPSAVEAIIPDPEGKPIISIVLLGQDGRESYILSEGESIEYQGSIIGFNAVDQAPDFSISMEGAQLFFQAPDDVMRMDMSTNRNDTLRSNTPHTLERRTLYTTTSYQLVLTSFQPRGKRDWTTGTENTEILPDVLRFEITANGLTDTFDVFGKANRESRLQTTMVGNVEVSLAYGPRPIQLPFELYLRDFQLDRYPGSNSPSSFASEVTLIDTAHGVEEPYRIFMNNILKYRGFRFFQSSYDNDEKGTILSVNHDAMGTILSYIGYFLLTLGMVLSIFNKNSRFMSMARASGNNGSVRMSGSAAIILLGVMVLFPQSISAQDVGYNTELEVFPKEQAKEFASVLVQDQGGRIKPLQTLASDIVKKVAQKEQFSGLDPVQVVMGMYYFPEVWQQVPMIKVSNPQLKNMLGVSDNFAAFIDFFDMTGQGGGYKLASYVQQVYQKSPGERSKFDQEIMKVDERVNISYMVYSGSMLKIFPVKGDPNQTWYAASGAAERLPAEDSAFVAGVMDLYRQAIIGEMQGATATEIVNGIKKFQDMNAPELIPASLKVKLEIFYQKAGMFQKLSRIYGLIGLFMLLVLFIKVLNQKLTIKWLQKGITFLLVLGFIGHTSALAIRWYIAGHAPLSNGYESMIFIAWATMLAGLIFVRKSPFALVAASLLASLVLMVAHMSWMNPEITNLVPVLKSYWLTIHVSVIITSYGFLGIGMVLGLINLFLYMMKTGRNHKRLQDQINVLTEINEMTLILGLYFITIGTFLGAVWANESWGRYWGWDPKETWALITCLVYVFITHMRWIPGLKGPFALNLASVAGFSSVLMTYFGVNYYLSGLHSYAGGDPVPVPTFVYYTVASLILIFLFSYFNELRYKKKEPVKIKNN